MIFQNPNVDLNWYRDTWKKKKGFEQVDQIHPFSSFIDNPFLITYQMTNAIQNHNIVGRASATYEITKNWSLWSFRLQIRLMRKEASAVPSARPIT
ncbi:MAG: hypothetical protein IPL27_19340 [Lewinellaceae bacterium]|nr:hypothetical protein [Lewinellaceae bacterium]